MREEGGGGGPIRRRRKSSVCTTGGSGSGDGTLRKLGANLARRTVRMDGVVQRERSTVWRAGRSILPQINNARFSLSPRPAQNAAPKAKDPISLRGISCALIKVSLAVSTVHM